MIDPTGQRKLRELLAELSSAHAIPQAAAALEGTLESTVRSLRDTIVVEIPAFSATGNPEVLPGLERHVREHVLTVHRLFAGREPDEFEFVRSHARLRAEQRFPLEVTLHAYRCGHRVLSRWLRDAVAACPPAKPDAIIAVADFAIEYTNTVSIIAAAEYVARTRILAEAEGDRRTELLNILLSGYDESDGRVAQLLKRAGYLEQRQAYCVVVAQAANASEMEHPERAQRIVSAMAGALSGTSIRVLAGVRGNLVTAVLSDRRRQSGWTAPQSNLAERIQQHLLMLGPAVVTGISSDHPSTAYLPKALSEAVTALDFASVTERIVQFARLPLRALLVHRGGGVVRATPPAWVQALFDADAGAAGNLVATLRAFAAADMNMQKAARAMGRHPNTLYARFERISEITGHDGQRYNDLTELLLAADCWRV